RRTVLGVGSTRRPAATSLAWASCPSDLLRAALRAALPGVEKRADGLSGCRCDLRSKAWARCALPTLRRYQPRPPLRAMRSERVQGSPSEPPRVGLSAGGQPGM